MKILLVTASAEWSTADVSNGYLAALRHRPDTEVIPWRLDQRLKAVGRFIGAMPSEENLVEICRHASRMAVEDALEHEVDWVLVISAMAFHPDAVVLLKRAGLQVAVLFTESPYDDAKQAPFAELCDFVATNDKASAERYGWTHLPAAFDPERHRHISIMDFNQAEEERHRAALARWRTTRAQARRLKRTYAPKPVRRPALSPHDVVIVGTGWEERVTRLNQMDWTDIDLALYGFWPQLDPAQDMVDFAHAAGLAEDAPARAHLHPYYTGRATDNDETVALYSEAKIIINDHRAHPDGYSANPRVYEALAVGGGLLLTDYRPEVADVLGDRWPEFVFTDAADLEAKIRYYLSHEDERRDLVAYGQAWVQGQTFDGRAATLLSQIHVPARVLARA